MSLSIGTIETYSTELDQTQYDGLNTEDSNSLTLSDSNLWLVDTTNLGDQTTDSFSLDGSTSLYSDGDSYLAPMASTNMESTTGGITMYSSDPNADNILYTGDPSLQLSESTPLLEIAGNTQSGGSPISSGGDLSSSTTGSDFTLTNSDPITDATISSGSLALGESGNSTESGDLVDSTTTTETTFEAVSGSGAGSDLALAPDIKDAPFEMHSALGLLVIAALVVLRRRQGWRRRPTIVLN